MSLSQQAKKEITELGEVIDPDYHEEIGLFLHNRGNPLGCFLVLPCSVIKVNGKL